MRGEISSSFKMSTDWIIATADDDSVQILASSLGMHPITARILINRGVTTKEAAREYLKPSISEIPNPLDIPQMSQAIERIARAIRDRERIAIFGDYDADGITGSALLKSFLREIGPDPTVTLPNRMGEGYGLTRQTVDDIHVQGANLIITVDNGTHAVEEVMHAKELGMDVVVTDHHDTRDALPQACAVVNPKCTGAPPQYRDLSGCGVAFMLAWALKRKLHDEAKSCPLPDLARHLDLVAFGTIADAVPLAGANRVLVRHGLKGIVASSRPGLKALIAVSGTNVQNLTPETVAFQLAPRINAAGRMGDAHRALELLLCEDEKSSFKIARELDLANRERQRVEQEIIDEVTRMLLRDRGLDRRATIVLASKGWHVGVIGIVAAKIAERFTRPAVIISLDTNPARGSARTAQDINLVQVLSCCKDTLVRYGGHAMAAGFSIDEENLGAFATKLEEACQKFPVTPATPKIKIDAVIGAQDLNEKLIAEISSCHPFGMGNPEPVLAIHDVAVISQRIVGERHLKLRVKSQGLQFDAIGFGMAKSLPSGTARASIAFFPEMNTWNGLRSVQLKIRDIKL